MHWARESFMCIVSTSTYISDYYITVLRYKAKTNITTKNTSAFAASGHAAWPPQLKSMFEYFCYSFVP